MTLARVLAAVVAAFMLGGLAIAFTAANSVQQSNAGAWSSATAANEVKPSACAGITLAGAPIVASGANGSTTTGTGGNDLMIATTARRETLNGGGGNDCLVAGGPNTAQADTLSGGAGAGDVCFKNGNNRVTTTASCETVVP